MNRWDDFKAKVRPEANEKEGIHGDRVITYLAEGDQRLTENEGSQIPGWYHISPDSCWIGPYLTSTDAFNRKMY